MQEGTGASQSHESLSWGSGNGVGMGSDTGRFRGTWRLDRGEERKNSRWYPLLFREHRKRRRSGWGGETRAPPR